MSDPWDPITRSWLSTRLGMQSQREFHQQPAKMEVFSWEFSGFTMVIYGFTMVLMGRFLGNDYGFTMVIYGK